MVARSFVLAIGLLISPAISHAKVKGTALVYAGPGTDEGSAKCAANVARKAGLKVKFVHPRDIQPQLFTGAEIWVTPGGWAITMAEKIGPKKLALIRSFIENGKSYFGICAGGFLADRYVDDRNTLEGLGIIPVISHDYSAVKTPITMGVRWGGEHRQMYFQDGPGFAEPAPGAAEVVARYPDGVPAALITSYGRGRVAVSGPHPEAAAEWFHLDQLERSDGYLSDEDLARDLLESVLSTQSNRCARELLTMATVAPN